MKLKNVPRKAVIVEFDLSFLEKIDEWVKKLSTFRSEFVRSAIEEKIKMLERGELKKEFKEAYQGKTDDAMKTYLEFGEQLVDEGFEALEERDGRAAGPDQRRL